MVTSEGSTGILDWITISMRLFLGQTLLVICGIIMSTQTIFSMIAIIHLIRMIFLSIILALRLHLMFSTESLDFTVGSYWDDQGGGNDIEQVVESGDLLGKEGFQEWLG